MMHEIQTHPATRMAVVAYDQILVCEHAYDALRWHT